MEKFEKPRPKNWRETTHTASTTKAMNMAPKVDPKDILGKLGRKT
jgi:hypothetical protein